MSADSARCEFFMSGDYLKMVEEHSELFDDSYRLLLRSAWEASRDDGESMRQVTLYNEEWRALIKGTRKVSHRLDEEQQKFGVLAQLRVNSELQEVGRTREEIKTELERMGRRHDELDEMRTENMIFLDIIRSAKPLS